MVCYITPNTMDLNVAIDIIIKDLNEARDIIEDLKRYPGVPAFQVELAKSKCRSAAEVITLLKDLSEKVNAARDNPQEKKEEKPAEIKVEPVVIKVEPPVEIVAVPPVEIRNETKVVIPPEQKPTINFEPKPAPRKPSENAILADQFSGMDESFNEKMGSVKHDDDIVEMMKSKPLDNLSEAIGINDRFLFIREIFKGDQDSYNAAIIKLNSAPSLTDAKALIVDYTRDNADNEAVKQLMDLLKRKFHSYE
jgi:hypothetical protein